MKEVDEARIVSGAGEPIHLGEQRLLGLQRLWPVLLHQRRAGERAGERGHDRDARQRFASGSATRPRPASSLRGSRR
jgi:hypothetical protein